eukprot:273018_1
MAEKNIHLKITESNITCNGKFSECKYTNRIKAILQQYGSLKIKLNDKKELRTKTIEMIIDVLSDENDPKSALLSDFYHIKYDHNTCEDDKQFNEFYKHLFEENNVLECDITGCHAAKRHYNRRNISKSMSAQNIFKHHDQYLFDIICQIHTDCIHSYQTTRLTLDELQNIERKIEECKGDEDEKNEKRLNYTTQILMTKEENIKKLISNVSDDGFCSKLAAKFKNCNINIQQHELEIAIAGYDEKQMIEDISDVIIKKSDCNTLLQKIFTNELQQTDNHQRKRIYDLILDLEFKNILKTIVTKSMPQIDIRQFEDIVENSSLNAKIFEKGCSEFINSKKFASMFKSVKNSKKKEWAKVYLYIAQFKKDDTELISTATEMKVEEKTAEYIDEETDIAIMQTFCNVVSNANDDTAAMFLKKANFDINQALELYYETNDSSDTLTKSKIKPSVHAKRCIYSNGIQFWYWKCSKDCKRYIQPKWQSLKEEILSFKKFTINTWDFLVTECETLKSIDTIKKIVSNGNNLKEYGIQEDAELSIDHVIATKLYTDFTALCNIFCQAFRQRKIASNQYERIDSVKHRNKKIANWAKLLTETVQCYGAARYNDKAYFRGVDNEFVFRRLIVRFHAPLSTSFNWHKAAGFAQNGLILEFRVYKDFGCAFGFNTSVMSDFPQEKEILFFGGNTTLQISSILQAIGTSWVSHRKYTNGIQHMLQIAGSRMKWSYKNNMKDIIGCLLPGMYADNKKLPSYIKSLLVYQLSTIRSRVEYDISELSDKNQYTWVKDIFVKHDATPRVSNLCNLFPYCGHIVLNLGTNYMIDDAFVQI